MNFKRFLLFLVAPLAMVMSSCEPDTPVYTTPAITIADANGAAVTALNFNAEGGEQSFTITATRGWNISKTGDWFAISPSSATNESMEEKTTEVKITVAPNDGEARTETIKVVMEKTEKNIVVSQAGEGQTALGAEIFGDNFDNGTAQDNSGWPALDGFVNPTGAAAEGVTYTVANVQARSNSPSNNSHSGYKDEASGNNNAFFRTNGVLTINNINLSAQTSKDYTLTFGCYRSVFDDPDNSFKSSEFHVLLSADGEKWTEVAYTRPADEVSNYGTWNKATATFSLKEKPATLSVRFVSDLVSSHRLDDVKFFVGGGGEEIDLANGTTSGGNTGGGNTEVDPNAQAISVADFIAAADTATTYQLTGVISGSINTTYGNFDLVDETGSIYIYGLVDTTGANVNWTTKGLNAGDTITVQGKYYLYTDKSGNTKHEIVDALYVSHVDGEGGETPETPEQPEVELPEGTIVWTMGTNNQNWADDTHATYGAGTAATVDNIKFGFYKNTNTNDWSSTLNVDHVRVFKNAALSISTLDGSKIKSVVFDCMYADKCYNLSVADGSTAVADTNALTVTWTSEEGVSTFDAVAAAGQLRIKKMYLVLAGAEGGETPENPEGGEPTDPENPEGGEPTDPENPEGGEPTDPENPEGGETPEEPETPVEPETPAVTTLTVQEFLNADEDASVWYQLTGVVKNIVNTQYGNFDLVDETGSVYVYGLTATQVSSNDKSFSTLGLVDGDTVTLMGVRSSFNGTAQVGGPAYYVSHVVNTTPRIYALSATSLLFVADGGEKTVTVNTLGEGGVLAATTAAEWLTVSAANGVVTVVAAANEGETRTAEVTVTFGEDTATVLVSQSAPVAEGEATWHTESWSNASSHANAYQNGTINGDLGTWTYDGCSTYDEAQFTSKVGLALGKTEDIKEAGHTAPIIVSPTFDGGIQGIKFNYFANNTARKVVVNVYENGSLVYTQTIQCATKNALGAAEVEVTTTGATYFEFVGDKTRRFSIGDIEVKF